VIIACRFIDYGAMQLNDTLNKDLILRENLVIESTDMAIDRTLLAC
jgi:hypothetical protein